MTDRPILFKDAMVRAILSGNKTQTRRILTRRNTYYDGGSWPKKDFAWYPGGHDEYQWDKAFVDGGPSPIGNPGPYLQLPVDHFAPGGIYDHSTHRIYPRVKVGDRFWVKETWSHDAPDKETFMASIQDAYRDDYSYGPYYKSTASQFDIDSLRWRTPLHMPKLLARLFLKVTRIRIERVQEISEADAIAEGVRLPDDDDWPDDKDYSICPKCGGTGLYNGIGPSLGVIPDCDCTECNTHKKRFKHLWNSIHKDKHPWEANEWCLIYDFERVER
jgi:hypothetical protein